jgi:hypothetical protein
MVQRRLPGKKGRQALRLNGFCFMGNPRECPAFGVRTSAPAHDVRDVLKQLALSITTSERKFEELCRDYARGQGLESYGFGRQSIRDALLFGLSAHKLATLHEVCGVRFGSLVCELCGIQLNDLARWHMAAYPDRTIRLPDYLWNPEVSVKCPVALNTAPPGANMALLDMVAEWGSMPLEALDASSSLRVFRIGDLGMRPLYHPGDLVIVDTSSDSRDRQKIQSRQPVIVWIEGRYRLCWIEPSRNVNRIFLAFTSPQYPAIEIDPERIQLVGTAFALFKDLRAKPPDGNQDDAHPLRSREGKGRGDASNSKLGELIQRYRKQSGASLRELIESLERAEPSLPPQLAGKIPGISSLNAIERQGISRPRLPQLLLLSIALQLDLRRVLAAVGINIQDAGKVSVAERIEKRPSPPITKHRLAASPLADTLRAKWRGVPWLLASLLPFPEADSIFYFGKRSRFMHPMMTDHCFVIADLTRNQIPQTSSRATRDQFYVDSWPRMYVLKMTGSGQIVCAQCRRQGDTLHLISLDQFGGERLACDLRKEVSVLGQVTGVLSCFP